MTEKQQTSLCIFCLRPSSLVDATENCIPFLRIFSRFINIHPDFVENCDGISNELVSCEGCKKRCESFSKLFFEWEQNGLILTSIVREVFDIIKRSKLASLKSRGLTKPPEVVVSLNENVEEVYSPIEDVRQVLLEHCEQEVMRSLPNVEISREDEKRCNEKRKKLRKKKIEKAAIVSKNVNLIQLCCPLCKFQTKFRGALGNHLKHTHKRILAYQCRSCALKLQTVEGFRRHMYHLHGKEFETNGLLMSKMNVSYGCFDMKWVAKPEGELELEMPNSSSSLASVSESQSGKDKVSFVTEKDLVSSVSSAAETDSAPSVAEEDLVFSAAETDSAPSVAKQGQNNSDGEANKELQLQPYTPNREKSQENGAKPLVHECEICLKSYTSQRSLEIHRVYRHNTSAKPLNGKRRHPSGKINICTKDRRASANQDCEVLETTTTQLNSQEGQDVAQNHKCPIEGCQATYSSMSQLMGHFNTHEENLEDEREWTSAVLGGSSPKPEDETTRENQPIPNPDREISNDDCDEQAKVRTPPFIISDQISNLQVINGGHDNYPFKCPICVYQAVNKGHLNAHMQDHF